MRLESKIGTIRHPDKQIYNFLSNFNNFKHLIPADKIQDWQSDEDSCSFRIDPIGTVGLKIIEKEPYKLIKLANREESSFNFTFWAQLKQQSEDITYIKLTLDAQLNKMMEMMVQKPLQEFLNKLVDELVKYHF